MNHRQSKLKTTLIGAGLVTFLMAASGCQSTTEKAPVQPIEVSPQGLQKVVNHTADTVIIDNLKRWQADAIQLSDQSQNFCKSVDHSGLEQLQASYKLLSSSWNQSVMFDFGPLRDNLFFPKVHFIESMRQRGRDYTKTIQSHLKKRMSDDKPLNDAYFKKLKFTLVGMSAIEIMLFEKDSVKLLQEYQQSRKCQLLTGLVKLNADNATYVVEAWQTAGKDELSYRQQFFANKLADGEQSLTKLIFAMQDYLRYIKQRKLDGKLDAKLSGLSYENLATGLQAVEDTFSAKDSGYGLVDYLVKAGKAEVVERFYSEMAKAKQAVQQRNIAAMKQHYSALTKMFERDIPQALGVNLGMNFVDGD